MERGLGKMLDFGYLVLMTVAMWLCGKYVRLADGA